MEHTALSGQINQVRNSIVGLRDHLEDTLGRLENLETLAGRTAEEAQEVARTLGRERPTAGLLSIGWLGFLGIGLAALYVFSPQTVNRWFEQARHFFEQRSHEVGRMAQERFRDMPPRS